MSIPPCEDGPCAEHSDLGVIGGDVAGYPNGRRLTDDVIDISLQVVEGELLGNPNDLGDGVDSQRRRLPRFLPLRCVRALGIERGPAPHGLAGTVGIERSGGSGARRAPAPTPEGIRRDEEDGARGRAKRSATGGEGHRGRGGDRRGAVPGGRGRAVSRVRELRAGRDVRRGPRRARRSRRRVGVAVVVDRSAAGARARGARRLAFARVPRRGVRAAGQDHRRSGLLPQGAGRAERVAADPGRRQLRGLRRTRIAGGRAPRFRRRASRRRASGADQSLQR